MNARFSKSLLSVVLIVVLALAITPGAGAQEGEKDGGALALGDKVTGELLLGQRARYTLTVEEADKSVDILLAANGDGMLYIYDENGEPSETIDAAGDYQGEVYTLQPGDPDTVQIGVGFWQDSTAGEYTLSIQPMEQQINEEPVLGAQVKRWAELEVGEAGQTREVTLPYLLYVPEDYDESKSYPFILFLHGFGEAGSRLEFLKNQVLPKLIEQGEDYPFIIASPQARVGDESWENKLVVLASFVASLQAEFPVDPDRIYVAGLSMGGAGAWHFALAYPELPAAVVPMAGFYFYGSAIVPRNICDLADIPMWVFHGGQDEVVDLAWEQALVDALKACGADVKFTIYPDADHGQSFERGFAEVELYAWLLEQHK